MKKIIKIIINIVFFLVLLLILSSYLKIPYLSKIKFYAVASQSMTPVLNKGDLIVVKEFKDYQKGDVITFTSPKPVRKFDTVTHRIISIEKKARQIFYITKGDANNTKDSWKINKINVHGKYFFKVFLVGTIVSFAKTPFGLVFLIIIPAAMIIYSEMLNIKKEISRLLNKNAKK